jgi:hypothetical protein
MKPENLETAARFAQKRRELKEIYDILSSYVTSASVTVTVPIGVNKQKNASIQSDTFNALMAALVEKEIKNIDEFVKQL